MIYLPKVFVSYTLRDGLVTPELLKLVENNLQEICEPFIHATTPNYNEVKQFDVMKKLCSSHIILLIESPLVKKSPWVRIEILLAKIIFMPIIRINVNKLTLTLGKGLTKKSS